MRFAESEADLEAIYGEPGVTSLVKVADHLTDQYRAWVEAAPFCALATIGPEGLDCSPRGDRGQVVTVVDDRTLALPDRRGNNRMDSLRNIVRDPRVSCMFLVPGSNTVIRVNGEAQVAIDAETCEGFTVEGKAPRSVVMVRIREVYFQCARACMRAGLWDVRPDLTALPSPGAILGAMSKGEVDGRKYDEEWPGRAAGSMW